MTRFSRLALFIQIFALVTICLLVSSELAAAPGPKVIRDTRHDTSAPLRDIANLVRPKGGEDREAAFPRSTNKALNSVTPDPVAQELTTPLSGVSIVANFEGQSADDNRAVFGFAFVPPDTNGAAGATQFVQIVNVTLAIYDKATASLDLGLAAIISMWACFDVPGNTENGGDPVVMYDKLANRWLVSQFQFAGRN